MILGIEHLQILKNEIAKGLQKTQSFINDLKSNNSDLSFLAELYLEELLNEIYSYKGYSFKNLNFKKKNYPAIDLSDEENGISYQVTITNDVDNLNSKVNSTLEKFYSNHFDKDYQKLYIIVASGIKDKSKLKDKYKIKLKKGEVELPASLFNKDHIIDLIDLSDYIIENQDKISFDAVNSIINKTSNRPKSNNQEFKLNHKYIKRKINNGNKDEDLLSLLNKESRIVLLGVGGFGKTTEVNILANRIRKIGGVYCFIVRLIRYANTLNELLDISCPNWQNVPNYLGSYFLFDGLDEVPNEKIKKISNEIQHLSHENANAKILITCRNNFNPFTESIEDEELSSKDHFKICYLRNLTSDDINTFIKNECTDHERFLPAIKKSQWDAIFVSPYFLVNAVQIFNKSKTIPQNKTDFFNHLLKSRKGLEKSKDSLIWHEVSEYDVDQNIQSLAVVMQFSGSYEISNCDYSRIVKDQNTRRFINRFIFNSIEDKWSFEHNNFQEFLAALKLSKYSWDIIAKIILLKNKKLKPSWLNAFSFLLNLSDDLDNLVDHFIKYDIESLIIAEPEKIEENLRSNIFKKIYNKHKEEATLIWLTPYTISQLFNFGNINSNNNLIEFLITELKAPKITKETISNLVRLLTELDSPKKYKDEIINLFLSYLETESNHSFAISKTILESFTKWKCFDKEIKDKMISNKRLFEKGAPVAAFCNYLLDGKFTDLNAKLILKMINSISKARIIGIEYGLYNLIERISSFELEILIKDLSKREHRKYNYSYVMNLFREISIQATKGYKTNPGLKSAIVNFLNASFAFHDNSFVSEFIHFFDSNNLVEETFKESFITELSNTSDQRRWGFNLPALIINQVCLEWVITKYKKNPFPDCKTQDFIYALRSTKKLEACDLFLEEIRELSAGKFDPKPNPWEIYGKRKEELWCKALLDKEYALGIINKAFLLFDSDQFSRNVFVKKYCDFEFKLDNVELATGLELINNTSGEWISKKDFLKNIESNSFWEFFVAHEHLELLKHSKLYSANKKWVIEYCNRELPLLGHKHLFQTNEAGETSFFQKTFDLIQFAMFFNLELSEQQLLELTKVIGITDFNLLRNSTDGGYLLNNYLKEKLSDNKLKEQIISNLKIGDLDTIVLYNHIDIVQNEKWDEGINLLPFYIKNKSIQMYARRHALSVYRAFDGDITKIIPTLYDLDFKNNEDHFDWEVIDFLTMKNSDIVVDFLLSLLDRDVDKLKVGIYLLIAKCSLGFDVIKSNFTLLNQNSSEFLLRTIDKMDINSFTYTKLIDFLVELINFQIQSNKNIGRFLSLISIVFGKLYECVIYADAAEEYLFGQIEEIFNNSPHNDSYKKAQYEFYELTKKLNVYYDSSCNIETAIEFLSKKNIFSEL